MTRRLALGGLLFFLPLSTWAAGFEVEFIKLADQVWMHRSYAMLSGTRTPSKDLVLEPEYLGPGHAPDNIAVWNERDELLTARPSPEHP
jgi:hypothetical protein